MELKDQVEQSMKAAKAISECARQDGMLVENSRIWKAMSGLEAEAWNKVEQYRAANDSMMLAETLGMLKGYLEVKKILNEKLEVKP